MKYRGIFEYEYPTEHKPPISIDVHLHGDCVKGKIIECEYRPLEQEPRWIPVEERLPDIHNYSEKYLVTLKRGWVRTAMCTQCDGKHWWTYDDVIAWMPLPQSYKAESEE